MKLLWPEDMLVEQGRRLERVALALYPMSDKEIAEKIGVSPQSWGNYTAGRRPLWVPAAVELMRIVPGLTLDWLYTGNENGLSVGVRDMLAARPPAVRMISNSHFQPDGSVRKRTRHR